MKNPGTTVIKTESENYAAEYIRNFVENEPIPGIDYDI